MAPVIQHENRSLFYGLAGGLLVLCGIIGSIAPGGNFIPCFLLYALIWILSLFTLMAFPRGSVLKSVALLMILAVLSRAIILAGIVFFRGQPGTDTLRPTATAGMDLITIVFLLRILIHRNLNVRWVFLYLFHPVILSGLVGDNLIISAALCTFMGAMDAYQRVRYRLMFILSGITVAAFPPAVLGIVFLINRKNIGSIGYLLVFSILAICGRFFFNSGADPAFWFVPASGVIPGALSSLILPILSSRFVDAICYAATLSALCAGIYAFHPLWGIQQFRNDPVPGLFLIFGSLILFLPSISVSIFAWAVPMMVVQPALTGVIISLTVGGACASGCTGAAAPGSLAGWPAFMLWLPVYLAAPFTVYRLCRRLKQPLWEPACRTLSVVIPARNEEKRIGRCARSVRADPAVHEVIVVDGGSTDRTVDAANAASANVIFHDRPVAAGGGRGGQIRAGVMAATGDVVAVVHADAVVASPVFSQILNMLNQNPTVIGGAAGCCFDSEDRRFMAINLANDFRMAFFNIAFGDQVHFFRRLPVVDKDLFPDIPLMEDVEFSLRLQGVGRQVFLFADVQVSKRRWREKGFKNAWWVLRTMSAYLWQRMYSKPDTAALYRHYYP